MDLLEAHYARSFYISDVEKTFVELGKKWIPNKTYYIGGETATIELVFV